MTLFDRDFPTPHAATPLEVLAFCHRHDWGHGARLSDDCGTVTGLEEIVADRDGNVTCTIISLPARLSLIRAWAGY